MFRSGLLGVVLFITAVEIIGCAGSPPTSSITQSGMAMAGTDYITAAAESDQFEIQEAQLALGQSQNARVRDFANMMIRDHTQLTQRLKSAVAQSGLPMPPNPPLLRPDHQQMISQLQGLNGSAFDRVYMSQQVTAHQDALSLQSAYAQGGADSNLRAVALSAVPIIRHHQDEARQLQASIGVG